MLLMPARPLSSPLCTFSLYPKLFKIFAIKTSGKSAMLIFYKNNNDAEYCRLRAPSALKRGAHLAGWNDGEYLATVKVPMQIYAIKQPGNHS